MRNIVVDHGQCKQPKNHRMNRLQWECTYRVLHKQVKFLKLFTETKTLFAVLHCKYYALKIQINDAQNNGYCNRYYANPQWHFSILENPNTALVQHRGKDTLL